MQDLVARAIRLHLNASESHLMPTVATGINALTEQVTSALALFSSTTRLYALTVGDGSADLGPDELLVEAFAAHDAVQEIGACDVIVLSTSAYLKLEPLLGQPATMEVSLADGRNQVCMHHPLHTKSRELA